MTYDSLGFTNRVPSWIKDRSQIYDAGKKMESNFTMHSALVLGHGFEYLDYQGRAMRHTDYRLQIASKLFNSARRNLDGTYSLFIQLFRLHYSDSYLYL